MRTILLLLLLLLIIPAGATRWYSYEEGMAAAGANGKSVIIDFYADWCLPCVAMEQGTYPDPRVVSAMEDLIAIKVDTQKRIDIERRYGVEYYPTVVLLNPDGKEVARYIGYLGPEDMATWIQLSRERPPREVPEFQLFASLFAILLLYSMKKRATG